MRLERGLKFKQLTFGFFAFCHRLNLALNWETMASPLFIFFILTSGALVQGCTTGAAPGAIVQFGKARFSVLTSSLARMEFSKAMVFDDRATLSILTRCIKTVPKFSVSMLNESTISISTEFLNITFSETVGDVGYLNF